MAGRPMILGTAPNEKSKGLGFSPMSLVTLYRYILYQGSFTYPVEDFPCIQKSDCVNNRVVDQYGAAVEMPTVQQRRIEHKGRDHERQSVTGKPTPLVRRR